MLEVRDLQAWYGKSHILRGVDLDVGEGEIVSLLGRNGVGRSTTIKAIMGEVEPRGTIRFNGSNIAGLKSFQIARRGIGHIPEGREIFPTLTVRQNLLLGQKQTALTRGPWTMDEVFRLFPNLAERADVPGGVLSGGEQQMLCICRTLMGNPRLIMVDEPTEGLAPMVVRQISTLLEEIARRGVAILLVEQKLTIAMRLSHRVYVMGHGRTVYEGTPDTIREDADVRREWLGVGNST